MPKTSEGLRYYRKYFKVSTRDQKDRFKKRGKKRGHRDAFVSRYTVAHVNF